MKMCIRWIGFVLLFWFPGGLHAQSASEPCGAPTLQDGLFTPKQQIYSHGTKLMYICNDGRKPASQGSLGTSTCDNGTWSIQPQCIDANACFPPKLSKGQRIESPRGWYTEGTTIRVTCDKGYEPTNYAIAGCTNGAWSALPVCEKSKHSCSAPPQIPHAVIIHEGNQEVFAADSVVEYECEDGYTTEGGDADKSVLCISGNWTQGPDCKSSSGSTEREIQTQPISKCGSQPIVNNGVSENHQMFLKYQCNAYYLLVGPDKVKCYSNGTWSNVPTCTDNYCRVNTVNHPVFVNVGDKFIINGETKELECKKLKFYWVSTHKAQVHCIDRQLKIGKCCAFMETTHGCE